MSSSRILIVFVVTFLMSGCSCDSITPASVSSKNISASPSRPSSNAPSDSLNNSPVFDSNGTIYISGYSGAKQNAYSHAVLWQDGKAVVLPAMTAQSVFHSETNDVYVTAFTDAASGYQNAYYWKNGVRVTLSNEAITSSIFVSGNDVYVCGYDSYSGLYWKNGQANYLPVTDSIAYITVLSIFVSGADVYTAGTVATNKNYEYAAYWKNSEIHYLKIDPMIRNGSIYGNASSIYVSGNDVYVGGRISGAPDGQMASVWKNGIPTTLAGSYSYVNSVFISGADFYAAGFNNQGAAYWKNNVLVQLESSAEIKSIYVLDSDVYLAGSIVQQDGMHAVYWKNCKITGLEGDTDSEALSITVLKKAI